MVDVSKTIIPKSDQLNSDDLIAGPITVKISDVSLTAGDQPIAVSYEGDGGKPYKPCKSMRKVMVMLWGKKGEQYVGKSMTLYRDPDVTWGGVKVGGIRISHMSHIEDEAILSLTATKSVRKPFKVKPLAAGAATAPKANGDVLTAGDAAAAKGVAAYVAWRDALPDDVKATIKPNNGEWSKKAKAVDAAALDESSDDDDTP